MDIGILIPTFNRRRLLEEALASVLRQTHRSIEVIIIDNGSTDGTREFMRGSRDPRVRYIVNEQNVGLIESINRGIRAFSNAVTWCTVLSDDDTLHEAFIASMVRAHLEHPELDVMHGPRTLIDIRGNRILDIPAPPRLERATDYLIARSRFRRDTYLTGTFFSRSAFMAIGGYPPFTTGTATDDALLFALAISRGLLYNGDARSFVRIHGDAESLNSRDAISHIQAFDDFRRYILDKAIESNKFTPRELQEIRDIALQYAKRMNTSLWVRNVRSIKRSGREDSAIELKSLYEVAARGTFPFTFRVSVSLAFVRVFGWWAESLLPYWLFWEILDTFRKGIRKKWRILKITRAAAVAEHRPGEANNDATHKDRH